MNMPQHADRIYPFRRSDGRGKFYRHAEAYSTALPNSKVVRQRVAIGSKMISANNDKKVYAPPHSLCGGLTLFSYHC